MATVVKTIEQDVDRIGGKLYPITVTRLRSAEPFEFEHKGQIYIVDSATIIDAGERGISTVYTLHQERNDAAGQAEAGKP